jgi:hypothetical protein
MVDIMNDKYINLNSEDRFVSTELIRNSYLHYEDSLAPQLLPYISFPSEDLELGIVSGQVPEIAKAVSSILSRSLEDGKYTNGGYLPVSSVERVQKEIISPFGISHLWGVTGHRFILSRSAGPSNREIVASILVGRSKDTIFFLTGRYNNIQHSTIKQTVDLNQPNDSDPDQKWFDRFAIPDLDKFKPQFYHQIANFVVTKELRRQGLARFLIDNMVKYYSRDHITIEGDAIEHSQHLLCGHGFWQIGDPPWFVKMKALGFYLRGGAESFFIEQPWAPLPPIFNGDKQISNVEYNSSFGLPKIYQNFEAHYSPHHLLDRIPEVIKLSQDPRAKLQYFQAMYDFI